LQFAKDLYNVFLTDENLQRTIFAYQFAYTDLWIDHKEKWAEIFGVDDVETEDGSLLTPDPINDEYEIQEKPEDCEYPVMVKYDAFDSTLYWTSLKYWD
jgi:hypothetical protein